MNAWSVLADSLAYPASIQKYIDLQGPSIHAKCMRARWNENDEMTKQVEAAWRVIEVSPDAISMFKRTTSLETMRKCRDKLKQKRRESDYALLKSLELCINKLH